MLASYFVWPYDRLLWVGIIEYTYRLFRLFACVHSWRNDTTTEWALFTGHALWSEQPFQPYLFVLIKAGFGRWRHCTMTCLPVATKNKIRNLRQTLMCWRLKEGNSWNAIVSRLKERCNYHLRASGFFVWKPHLFQMTNSVYFNLMLFESISH